MKEEDLVQHVRALNGCNQRGGRMLSLIDLIEARTVDIGVGAYLAAMMQQGKSIIVGAKPGGAGKTAVMCACLNFIPVDMCIKVVDSTAVLPESGDSAGEACYLAHEIGPGSYYAYVWGQSAKAFFKLRCLDYMIASNMHADTLGQMHNQLCDINRIPREVVDTVTLKVFLRMRRIARSGLHRWVSHVYENDGEEDNLVWVGKEDGSFVRAFDSKYVQPQQEKMWRQFLNSCLKRQIRKIEDVRRVLMKYAG